MIPLDFTSAQQKLKAYFFPSVTGVVKATVIFLQGFPGIEGDELICEQLAQCDLNVLTFNYRGTFRSEGFFSFPNAVADVGAALAFVKGSDRLSPYTINPEKIVLGGWSLGGALVPPAACLHPEFAQIFSIAGRDFGKEARKIARDNKYSLEVTRNLEAIRTPIGPVNFRDNLLAELIENQEVFDLENLAPFLKDRKILLISGWEDGVVPVEDNLLPFYHALVSNGAQKVSIEVLQDDHEFSKSKDMLVEIITDWFHAE